MYEVGDADKLLEQQKEYLFSCEQHLKRKRLLISIIIILNIISGTSVVLVVLFNYSSSTSSLNPSQKQTDSLRKKVDEVYYTVKKNLDSVQPPIPGTRKDEAKLEVLNLLKPVSQLSGLNFEDDKLNNHRRNHFTVIRNWANIKEDGRYFLWNGMK